MITNSRELFLVNIGLIHAGANFHNSADEQICRLVDKIRALDLPTEVTDWFSKARTGQVEVNPFYPRGSNLAAACFFLQDGKLNNDTFYSFLEEYGTHDPIGESDFRGWIERFSEVLSHMLSLPGVIPLWQEYENLVADRSEQWRDMFSGLQNQINGCCGGNTPELAFCPNLFNQYLADFVRFDNTLIVIAAEPNAEAMLHEALHPLIAEYRSLFIEYSEKQDITLFADEAAMLRMGYMADASAESKVHILEECFVRALSVTLSGNGSERADFHKNSGFRLTAYLAERFGESEVNRRNIIRVVKTILNEYAQLHSAIHTMTSEITAVLSDLSPTIYLYGSVTLGDFQLGWSDIDILVLTNGEITQAQADKLVGLRQTLLEREPDNAYYRSFEGGMLDISAFVNSGKTRTVYWGTSGQRITDSHKPDSFSVTELLESGILLHGADVRDRISPPTYGDLRGDVMRAYETIRKYAQTTNHSIKSYGWLLDIARGIYTLRTGKVIAKTAAGEWALENNLCPNIDAIQNALFARKNLLIYKDNTEILGKTALLGEDIQWFADVLEREFQSTAEMFARGELNAMGIEHTALTAMQYKDGVALWRVKTTNGSMVLKCFDKHEYRREIENYRIMRELNIPTLKVHAQTPCSLLMEDIESGNWRLGIESDLHDLQIAVLVAHWYRVLHERGCEYAESHALYDECDCLTLENIALIKAKTNTEDATVWAGIEANFEQIRAAALSLPRTLTYNDYYYTNLAVRKDGKAALIFDYNLLGKGYVYSDIRNVCSSLGDKAKEAFMAEYGEFNRREIAIDDVVCPIVSLFHACEKKVFPQWANSSLADVKNGTLLAAVERLLVREKWDG